MTRLNVTLLEKNETIDLDNLMQKDMVFQWTENNKLKIIKSRYIIIGETKMIVNDKNSDFPRR